MRSPLHAQDQAIPTFAKIGQKWGPHLHREKSTDGWRAFGPPTLRTSRRVGQPGGRNMRTNASGPTKRSDIMVCNVGWVRASMSLAGGKLRLVAIHSRKES